MTNDERMAKYRAQNGRLTLTGRQYKQVLRMANRALAKDRRRTHANGGARRGTTR